MLIKPTVDEVLDKVDCRYELVHLAAKRARDVIRSKYKSEDEFRKDLKEKLGKIESVEIKSLIPVTDY